MANVPESDHSSGAEAQSPLGLLELLSALRQEIEAAQARLQANSKEAMLELTEVEAEVHFLADKVTSGKGGVNIHFFAAEAKREYKSENVHKLKIVLRPKGGTIEFAETELDER